MLKRKVVLDDDVAGPGSVEMPAGPGEHAAGVLQVNFLLISSSKFGPIFEDYEHQVPRRGCSSSLAKVLCPSPQQIMPTSE